MAWLLLLLLLPFAPFRGWTAHKLQGPRRAPGSLLRLAAFQGLDQMAAGGEALPRTFWAVPGYF